MVKIFKLLRYYNVFVVYISARFLIFETINIRMDNTIRKFKREDLPQILELIRELAAFEK
ncbi:MAG TPA: hypothetical protein VLN72_09145 [Gillisia sp.]|nr:hypothetical protein [Gillisia sp.]